MHQFRKPVYSRLLKKLSPIFVLFSGEGWLHTDYSLQRLACVSLKVRRWRYPRGKRRDWRKERGIGASRRVTKGGKGKGNWARELTPPVNPVSSVIYINVGDETVKDCLWLYSHYMWQLSCYSMNTYQEPISSCAYPIFDSPFKRLARRSPPPPSLLRGGVPQLFFGWVCAAGLSEPLPHYNLFWGKL